MPEPGHADALRKQLKRRSARTCVSLSCGADLFPFSQQLCVLSQPPSLMLRPRKPSFSSSRLNGSVEHLCQSRRGAGGTDLYRAAKDLPPRLRIATRIYEKNSVILPKRNSRFWRRSSNARPRWAVRV